MAKRVPVINRGRTPRLMAGTGTGHDATHGDTAPLPGLRHAGPDELRVIEVQAGDYGLHVPMLGALEDHLGSTAMKVRAGGLPHIARYSGFGRDASTLPTA